MDIENEELKKRIIELENENEKLKKSLENYNNSRKSIQGGRASHYQTL